VFSVPVDHRSHETTMKRTQQPNAPTMPYPHAYHRNPSSGVGSTAAIPRYLHRPVASSGCARARVGSGPTSSVAMRVFYNNQKDNYKAVALIDESLDLYQGPSKQRCYCMFPRPFSVRPVCDGVS
jgi:hypothetical protein